MSLERRIIRGGRRTSFVNPSYYRNSSRQPPVIWNLQGVRGQISKNCLWHACRAFFGGLMLFGIGTIMCIYGFYSDGVFDEETNGTRPIISREDYLRDPNRHVRFSKLSYIGPIVMGVGGFIIVATCVMTFEARDSAAKVGPAAIGTSSAHLPTNLPSHPSFIPTFKKPKEHRSIGTQTYIVDPSALSSSLVLFQTLDQKSVMEAFRKFSKTFRSTSDSTDSGKDDGEVEFHRSPSAPSLLHLNSNAPTPVTVNTRRFLARNKPRVPPAFLPRQAMSVDYPSVISSSSPPRTSCPPSASCPTSASSSRGRILRQNSSTQTLVMYPTPSTPQLSKLNTEYPTHKIFRSFFSTTSSECNHSFDENTETDANGTSINSKCEKETTIATIHDFDVHQPVHRTPPATRIRSLDQEHYYNLQGNYPTSPTRFHSTDFSCNRPSLSRQARVDLPLEHTALDDSEDLSTILE